MSRRLVTLLLGLLLPLALVAMACGGGGDSAPAAPAAPASTAPSATIDLKTTSNPYAFDPAIIAVNAGETITIQGDTQFHTFTVNDLGIDEAINPNSTISVTLDKPGTYKLICIPHESLGMVGTITVK